MAVTYSWNVTAMSVLNTDPQKPEYVVQVQYVVIGTEVSGGTTYKSEISNTAFFDVDPTQTDYIPYADLTNEIVIGWVQTQLGPDAVGNYEYCIADQIANQINPPVTPQPEPLPWA